MDAGGVCHLENLKRPTGIQGVSRDSGGPNVHQTYPGMGAHGGSERWCEATQSYICGAALVEFSFGVPLRGGGRLGRFVESVELAQLVGDLRHDLHRSVSHPVPPDAVVRDG